MKYFVQLVAYLFSIVLIILLQISNFYNISVFISRIPFKIGEYIRYSYYKRTLDYVGSNVLFSYGVIFSHQNISVGNNVRFGPFNTIGLVDFGNDIIIAQNVDFLSGSRQHSFQDRNIPFWKQKGILQKVKINNNVWIGAGCIIMDNISENTVVGSGSIITKQFRRNLVIAGNPARIIKEI